MDANFYDLVDLIRKKMERGSRAHISQLSFDDAARKIVEYIELYYNSNSERLHSGINYSVPNRFFTLLSVHFS